MKKSKIIIFSTALVLLLFANISVTLFDGKDSKVSIELNSTKLAAQQRPVDFIADSTDDYSCTVTTNCYDGSNNIQGTISCTGDKSCSRGYGYVKCDDHVINCTE